MFFNKTEQSHSLTDQAVKSTQRVADEMVDSVAGAVQDIRHHAAATLDRASDQVSALAHRSMKSVRGTSEHLRESALRASDSTVNYIKDEPIKSMLIAAATGAAIVGLLSLLSGSHKRH